MGIFQILFVAVNLAVPYYLWSGSSKSEVKVNWINWERNLGRLIDGEGGFAPCGTQEIVLLYRELCELSQKKTDEHTPTVIERAGQKVVFSCEIQKNTMVMHWYANSDPSLDLECELPGGEGVDRAAGFALTDKGRMKSLDFFSGDGQMQSVSLQNCRKKALRARSLASVPLSRAEFLSTLGKDPADPSDFTMANHMCLLFDPSPLWETWRDRYVR